MKKWQITNIMHKKMAKMANIIKDKLDTLTNISGKQNDTRPRLQRLQTF